MDSSKKKIIIIVGVIIVVLLLIVAIIFIGKKSTSSNRSASPTTSPESNGSTRPLHQIVDIVFGTNPTTGALVVQKKSLRTGNVLPNSLAALPYELLILDSRHVIVYDTHFLVSQPLSVDAPIQSLTPVPVRQITTSIVSVPYFPNSTVIVTQNNNQILNFTLTP